MTAADFATIIRPLLEPDHRGWKITADGVLAAKVPELCLACKGLGCTCPGYCERTDDHVCPDCPTIAKLLAIGAAVMTDHGLDEPMGDYAHGWNHLLADLRAVQP